MTVSEAIPGPPVRPETRILEAATAEIAYKGLDGLDVRKIAKAAGTSTSQFHDYFQRTENLVANVFSHGWLVIERHVSKRLLSRTPKGVEDLVELIVNGILDAMEHDRNAVSATVIIGLTTIGQHMRPRLKSTESYSSFSDLVTNLQTQVGQRVRPEEIHDCLEALFAVTTRKLFMLTPLCSGAEPPPFDREVFLRVVRRMTAGLLSRE